MPLLLLWLTVAGAWAKGPMPLVRELRRDTSVRGVRWPAGTRLSFARPWRSDGEARPAEPSLADWQQAAPPREVSAWGLWATRFEQTTPGDGARVSAQLSRAQTVLGIPLASGSEMHGERRDGAVVRVSLATLGADYTEPVTGVTFPAGTELRWDLGRLSVQPARPVLLRGWLVRAIDFYADGKVSRLAPAAAVEVDGVRCEPKGYETTSASVHFHPNGHLDQCDDAAPSTLRGMHLQGGLVQFHPTGALRRATLASPTRRGALDLPAGTQIEEHPNQQLSFVDFPGGVPLPAVEVQGVRCERRWLRFAQDGSLLDCYRASR